MEENFYELIDNYLDEEEISRKKEIDKFEETNETFTSSDSPFTIEDAITINDFVNNFLNIKGNSSKLLHCGLKDLKCPYVVGMANDFANKNPELVKQGFLLIVIDYHGKRGTYINPTHLYKVLSKETTEEEYNSLMKKRINDLRELETYYNNYMILKNQVEMNQQFYNLLKNQRKTKKIVEIEKYEEMGEIENDKYKGR